MAGVAGLSRGGGEDEQAVLVAPFAGDEPSGVGGDGGEGGVDLFAGVDAVGVGVAFSVRGGDREHLGAVVAAFVGVEDVAAGGVGVADVVPAVELEVDRDGDQAEAAVDEGAVVEGGHALAGGQ